MATPANIKTKNKLVNTVDKQWARQQLKHDAEKGANQLAEKVAELVASKLTLGRLPKPGKTIQYKPLGKEDAIGNGTGYVNIPAGAVYYLRSGDQFTFFNADKEVVR